MIKNYVKIAFRNFLRYKWNSVFNILGLSLGIACSVYIYTLLKYELSYDRFHDDIDQIYRICQQKESRGETSRYGCVTHKYSDYILEHYDGIEAMARYAPNRPAKISYKKNSFMEDRHEYVEPGIFSIIKANFIFGDPKTCLDKLHTVVLSNTAYNKYFGSGDPLGEFILIDEVSFEVTGVIEDMPDNSRFRHDFYESWITYINEPAPEGWDRRGRYLTTYIKFKPEANIEAFKGWITGIPEIFNKDNENYEKGNTALFIQPLKKLHLSRDTNMIWDWEDAVNPVYIYILFGTVLLILSMSALNYINLSIASYSIRAREVGLRKTLGATRKQLIYQFIGESVLIVFIAHIIGIFLLEFFLPFLNNLTELPLVLDYTLMGTWIMIASIVILLGFGAGAYPAFYLTVLSPTQAEKNNIFRSSGKYEFKEFLIVVQFALSIILIIGTSLIFRQVNFMKHMDLGISLKDKIVIELPQGHVNAENVQTVKNEFMNTGLFINASISSSVPGRSTYTWTQWPTGEKKDNAHPINCMEVDYAYFDIYGIELAYGSRFDKNLSYETNMGYLLNEESVKVFGWDSNEDALVKTLGDRPSKVKGIIKNFHYEGLQKSIEPFGMFLGTGEDARYLTLQHTVTSKDPLNLDLLANKFGELFPDAVFGYFFIENDFNQQYKSEDSLVSLFFVITILAILIAVIGLFGMTAFYCAQKEKSMGLRKIFGAEPSTILISLIKRFSLWVIFSFIIAVPLSVVGIKMWLVNFAYRTDISITVILAAGLLSLSITILTVLFHSYKLSRKNPLDVIRYD